MDLAYMAALPQEEFTERRQKVFAQMQPNSALLLFSEIEKPLKCSTTQIKMRSHFYKEKRSHFLSQRGITSFRPCLPYRPCRQRLNRLYHLLEGRSPYILW
jgi:hypothetical protein